MKSIVTGSSGFIGSRLCHFLNKQDQDVIGVSRTGNEDHQANLICDFETDKLTTGTMLGIDTVFHLAGYAHDVSNPKKSVERYVKLNIEATKDLAIQASKEGVKTFVFISSVKAQIPINLKDNITGFGGLQLGQSYGGKSIYELTSTYEGTKSTERKKTS